MATRKKINKTVKRATRSGGNVGRGRKRTAPKKKAPKFPKTKIKTYHKPGKLKR